MAMCAGLGWDSFLHSCLYRATFGICTENRADNTVIFLNGAYTEMRLRVLGVRLNAGGPKIERVPASPILGGEPRRVPAAEGSATSLTVAPADGSS